MQGRGFAPRVAGALLSMLALAGIHPSVVLAQGDHTHTAAAAVSAPASPLVSVVRDATARFKDVTVAEAEGYGLQFGCVTGDTSGAMGLHWVNFPLVMDGGEIDPTHPEIVIYEPIPGGGLRLVGADYLVLASDWDAKHPQTPPQLMGQLFHLFESPNRFGLPPFYTLHVWAWKDNPTGTFVNWHANVSCDAFNGQN